MFNRPALDIVSGKDRARQNRQSVMFCGFDRLDHPPVTSPAPVLVVGGLVPVQTDTQRIELFNLFDLFRHQVTVGVHPAEHVL